MHCWELKRVRKHDGKTQWLCHTSLTTLGWKKKSMRVVAIPSHDEAQFAAAVARASKGSDRWLYTVIWKKELV